ncbi:MAG TPA: hypothetical protein VFR47_04055 [Anaerolineales bacterium]|nr:hypothetical protein [Anaerolineales bacterium]
MLRKSQDINLVAFSVRVYQLLLNAYPAKFQQEYGLEMVQVFKDCCLRTLRQGGTNGIVQLWAVTLLDLIQSVISEHAQKEIQMKKEMKPEDIRKAGWMLMLGALTFVFGTYWETSVWDLWIFGILSLAVCFPMMAYGLRGLSARYGEKVGNLGMNVLEAGAILGVVVSYIGLTLAWFVNSLFVLIYTGPAILLTSLSIFGVLAFIRRPMPRWNALPFIAGVWYPVYFLNIVVTRIMTGKWPSVTFHSTDLILMLLPWIGVMAIGYILQADAQRETAAPAFRPLPSQV